MQALHYQDKDLSHICSSNPDTHVMPVSNQAAVSLPADVTNFFCTWFSRSSFFLMLEMRWTVSVFSRVIGRAEHS